MEKINVAELLKDCPQGMELDCTIWNNVTFGGIDSSSPSYPIEIKIKGDKTTVEYLTKFGEWDTNENSKCVIFPKGKTTWEGFQKPFKDGDIVATGGGGYAFILKKVISYNSTDVKGTCYFGVELQTKKLLNNKVSWYFSRFATEEEKAELFKAIKENGYKWNEESKSLEKLAEPKFKVGDRVRNKYYKDYIYDIHDITDKGYRAKEIDADSPIIILFGSPEDNYELVPNKFDITTLKPFDKVLVRDSDKGSWSPSFWGYHEKCSCLMYNTVSGYYNQCIPYEGNEHLLGTTNDCDGYFKTWE